MLGESTTRQSFRTPCSPVQDSERPLSFALNI
jgi:hypothetical protein